MTLRPELNVVGFFVVDALVPYAPTAKMGNLLFSENSTARTVDFAAAAIIDHVRWQMLTQYANPAAAAVYIITGVLEAATLVYIGTHPNGVSSPPPK